MTSSPLQRFFTRKKKKNPLGKQERILLYLLAAVNFTHIVDFMIMMPLGDSLTVYFDINMQQFSILVSAYTLSAGVSGFMGAFFIDRFDRKTALIFTYTGFALGTLACAIAPTYALLLITRSLTGFFGGLIGALVMSIVSDAVPFERRGEAMGIIMSAFSAASVLGVPFGLYLNSLYSWHAPFFFLGSMSLMIGFLLYRLLPTLREHLEKGIPIKNPFVILKNIFTDTNQVNALLLGVALIIGQFMVIPFLAPYMIRNVGFTEGQLVYIYLLGGGLTLFTAPIVGRLADKYGKLRIFTIFMLLTIIPIVLITNMPKIHIAWALVVTGMFFVFASGRMIPAQAMITASVSSARRGSFMSIQSSTQQLSAGLSTFIGGLIIVESSTKSLLNYQYIGYFAIFTIIVAILIAPRLKVAEGN